MELNIELEPRELNLLKYVCRKHGEAVVSLLNRDYEDEEPLEIYCQRNNIPIEDMDDCLMMDYERYLDLYNNPQKIFTLPKVEFDFFYTLTVLKKWKPEHKRILSGIYQKFHAIRDLRDHPNLN